MEISRLDEGLEKVPSGRRVIRNLAERKRMAYKLALMGKTDKEMADFFGITVAAFRSYYTKDEEFREAILQGKDEADAEVVKSLYDCANGYEYEEEEVRVVGGEVRVIKVKKYKPKDSWAAARILALRQKALWSETHKYEITNTNININKIDISALSQEDLLAIEKIQRNHLMKAIGDS